MAKAKSAKIIPITKAKAQVKALIKEEVEKDRKIHLDGTDITGLASATEQGPKWYPDKKLDDEIKKPVDAIVKQGRAIAVTDQASYEIAALYLTQNKTTQAKVVEWFKASKSAALEAHRAICKQESDLLDPLKDDEKNVKKIMAKFLQEEEEKREAEAALAAKAEEERRKAEQEEEGEDSPYEREAGPPSVSHEAPAIREMPKANGIAMVDNYLFKIVDASKIPADYLMPDEAKIGRVVKAMRGEIEIPGVMVWKEKAIRAGRA